jgi:hypothetical protein
LRKTFCDWTTLEYFYGSITRHGQVATRLFSRGLNPIYFGSSSADCTLLNPKEHLFSSKTTSRLNEIVFIGSNSL